MKRTLIAIAVFLVAVSGTAAITLSFPDDASAPTGGKISIAVTATPADGIVNAQLHISYNTTVLRATGVTKTPISSSFTLTSYVPAPLAIYLSGAQAMSGSGPIAMIHFDVIGSPGQTSNLTFRLASINDVFVFNTPVENGLFTVCASPSVISGVVVTKGPGTTVQWTGQVAAVYDVAGGLVAQLRADGGATSASCLANDQGDASWHDPRPNPPAGTGYYYLVRGRNTCGPGSFGEASSGAQRLPAIDCP